ncbi:MAG: hypothetical protein KF773_42880 [Deltaproteobacteria bacterium]|nr:hypothetical protein [Deltaproteobacteria bacterium]MCW5808386.1 hypothetical protein [Deltaproteobacteria bacterium]
MGPRVLLSGLVFVVACARTISQDAHTAEDGRIKGAKAVNLENGEGKAKGIVTYPGGDRVDWKVIEIPDNKKGTLNLNLTWQTPRPGLKLSFDVFDEYQHQLLSAKRVRARAREAVVENAKGKYFVRIYAVGRGDAGKYSLAVEFKEQIVGPGFDVAKLDIPDPPKLAAVPEPEPAGGDDKDKCDEFVWDIKKPACKSICPAVGAPPGWPPCKGKCPNPPTVDEPACHATMPCPPGAPDERVKACTPDKWPPCPDKTKPDNRNPNCRIPADPVVGRIVGKELKGGELLITVGVGELQGVSKSWKGEVVRSNDVKAGAVSGGDVRIVRIDKNITVGSTKLTPDQIGATPYVRFSPK